MCKLDDLLLVYDSNTVRLLFSLIQDNMVHILEITLVDGMDSEFESSQPLSLNALVDSLSLLPVKSCSIDLQDHTRCLLQGIYLI